VAARTWQSALIDGRNFVVQQFAQRGGRGLVNGGPEGGLDGLQIDSTALATLREDTRQQLV